MELESEKKAELQNRLRQEAMEALRSEDKWLLISFTYPRHNCVSFSPDTVFAGFENHREMRGPRWRDFSQARGFANIGYRWIVAGKLTMAILAQHLLVGGKPVGVVMHRRAVTTWAPECGRPSPTVNSTWGFIASASPRYKLLGAPRLGRALRRQLMIECHFCRSKANLTLHHLIRREMGGATEPDNLLCVCRPCHERINRKEIDDHGLVLEVSLRRTEKMLGRESEF